MLTALYIHVPFCDSICTYCDFHKEVATFEKKKKYINALIKELKMNHHKYDQIESIYIGGGTPSSLNKELLELLLGTIQSVIDINKVKEYTIETNPNDITKEKALIFKSFGINRVSVGVQSFNDKHLQFMNRTHRKEDVLSAIKNLKLAGINNISVDLIFSLIDQTIEELEEDLNQLIELDIKHVSYYSLILEEKSKLYYLYTKDKISINSDELEALMYNKVIDTLRSNGFKHYEISNFSKENKNSIHNTIYWTNKEYLGIGSGAHSLYENKRFYNVASVKKYTEAIINETEYQTVYERNGLEEEMIMGLRLLKGINVTEVNSKYNIDIFEKYDKLHYFIEEDLLELMGDNLRFTRKGLLLGNIIFGHFLEG